MRKTAIAFLLSAVAFIALAATPLEPRVRAAVFPEVKRDELRALGSGVLPVLVHMYETTPDETQRTNIAVAFYVLGQKSDAAKRVLMRDVHTANESLRIQVQWALGRVSDDPQVIDVLADIMQHDTSPLFRDKAACALAEDQIHLSDAQKGRLFAKVIPALRDPKPQVRTIAITVLQIQTGQTKGYNPNAALAEREKRVQEWEQWLA